MHDEDVFSVSDELVDAVAALRPITATLWGVAGHDDRWDDMSPAGHEAARARLASFVPRAPAAAASDDRWTRLASIVLGDFLRSELDRYEHRDHLSDLNHIASPHQFIRMVFDLMDGATESGWCARVRRLETIGDVLGGYRESLALGHAEGRAVARRQVLAAIGPGRVHAGASSAVRAMPAAMAAAGVGDAELRARLDAAVPGACRAYGELSDWLEREYLPGARVEDGVGRERYLREARRFLGAELDPEEVYAWGFSEIAEIGERMRALGAQIAPGRSPREVIELLRTDPSRAAPSVEAFLDVVRARQRSALEQLSGAAFDVPEAVRALDVHLAPPGGPLGAYYVPPSEDFSRAGSIWYSPGDAAQVPLFDQIAIAYHEGFPGHHLQLGIQVGLTERLSRLHRVCDGYSGYAEGWALYAEELMAEFGYYESPELVFGMLSNQMVRACRVVIDIGAHLSLPIPHGQPFHPGEAWTFELGVEMLTTMAALAPDRAASEMTRYLGWPGQAISYKVGHRVMRELRAEIERREGASFDAKKFHATILGHGNVGLDHLRQLALSA